ncbi:tRNA (mnm(5)s(2)U34)-methyltransferase [Streptococcus oricebi]|uniref:SAM-dependent methyltransferase n=1 Tax=Streptococcus oricebi TaxID=1547447 RepID=A0ABS5B3J8_9STRE|nr:class I SAM-dependent methyltransferase [Streptococcus oricebi]MBP2623392.1 SAM-dependent methyltransferase [Streptococcus oricebi]
MLRPLQMAHQFLAEVIQPEDTVVDATMGNGHDTLFLAGLAKTVYAFDIQEEALIKTEKRLEEAGLTNAQLILAGHEKVDQYVTEPIRAAIFNLGYLPAADKSIITQPTTTLEALTKLCQVLSLGGRIGVMVYYGHEGGQEEKEAVLDFVSSLPQQEFTVAIYQTINQINRPPFLILIEKLKK